MVIMYQYQYQQYSLVSISSAHWSVSAVLTGQYQQYSLVNVCSTHNDMILSVVAIQEDHDLLTLSGFFHLQHRTGWAWLSSRLCSTTA
jgi:hypothetical protein